jgi:hypothetical protein
MQAKQAGPSALAGFAGESQYRNDGQRVVAGQHLMQASSDIFLGWFRARRWVVPDTRTARSGDRIAISAYLGNSTTFDTAVADFAETYADQNERDHAALAAAVADGRVEAQSGV